MKQSSAETMVRVKRPAMGSEFELIMWGRERDYLLDAAAEAFEEIRRLEEQMSAFIPTSEVSYINAYAGSRRVRVEPRLFELISRAQRLSAETEGAFDPTAGALVNLWASAVEGVPDRESMQSAMSRTGMSKVRLDADEHVAHFDIEGMKLDLGAFGKGYAVDETVEFLRDHGVENALVSAASSTVYALGTQPDGEAWAVGVLNPSDRKRIGSVRLRNRALSTSGSHERFVEIDGVRYSHIIDPRTGWPAKGSLTAAVIASNAAESDALSTAFFILGIEKTKAYCEAHPDVGAIFVTGPGSAPVLIGDGVEYHSEVFDHD